MLQLCLSMGNVMCLNELKTFIALGLSYISVNGWLDMSVEKELSGSRQIT